jgi:aspartyl-tRNA(Asn)/glutamyl-tRNA(Gln) amidotransferase subunit A
MDTTTMTAAELLAGYTAREFTPLEVVEAVASRIEAVDPAVRAFVALDLDRAASAAERSTREWRAGTARPLEGVPFAAKDVFDSAGLETSYGSRMFAGHVPAADADAVRLARDAGAILVGKTATHEFAWGLTGWNAAFDAGRNPWSPAHVAGGSSAGSATAVATGQVPLALGSDTGGSIRLPAAFCGVIGLKPSYGRAGAGGVFPLSPSLDHVGTLARSPADAALLLSVLCRLPPPPAARALRVGVCEELMPVELAPSVRGAFDAVVGSLRDGGIDVVQVSFPDAPRVRAAHGIIQRREALQVHRDRDLWPRRRAEYGPDVAGRLAGAEDVTPEQYLAATAIREQVRADFVALFETVDVLATPVCPCGPAEIGSEQVEHLGELRDFRDLVLPYTTPQNLAGLPACVVRAGFDDLGVPVGVQLTAAQGRDASAVAIAQWLHDATPALQRRVPPGPFAAGEGP